MSKLRFLLPILIIVLFPEHIYAKKIRIYKRLDNITNIGNIKPVDDEKYLINNQLWYYTDTKNIEPQYDWGKLAALLTYYIADTSSVYYGENVNLWIYDIEPVLAQHNQNRDFYYRQKHKLLDQDTTLAWDLWDSTNDFAPFLALKTGPGAVISDQGISKGYVEDFIIFANNRVYVFNFSNEKTQCGIESFEKRCLSVINSVDLYSFYQEEIKKLKQIRDELTRTIINVSIVTILGILVFVLSYRRKGDKNSQALKWLYYTYSCIGIALVVMYLIVFSYAHRDVALGAIAEALSVIIIGFIFCLLFCKKSKEDYIEYYLLSPKMIKWFKLTTEYRKRLIMAFLIYPLFAILPIPYLNFFFFIFYIIPISLIMCVIHIIIWLREGKVLDSKIKKQEKQTQLYCRYCGKLIDAKSKYCQYCGQEQ